MSYVCERYLKCVGRPDWTIDYNKEELNFSTVLVSFKLSVA